MDGFAAFDRASFLLSAIVVSKYFRFSFFSFGGSFSSFKRGKFPLESAASHSSASASFADADGNGQRNPLRLALQLSARSHHRMT